MYSTKCATCTAMFNCLNARACTCTHATINSTPVHLPLSCVILQLGSGRYASMVLNVSFLDSYSGTFFFLLKVLKYAFDQKSPKVHSESLDVLCRGLKEFGFL